MVLIPVNVLLRLLEEGGFAKLAAAVDKVHAAGCLDFLQFVPPANKYLRRHIICRFPYIGLVIPKWHHEGHEHAVVLRAVIVPDEEHHHGPVNHTHEAVAQTVFRPPGQAPAFGQRKRVVQQDQGVLCISNLPHEVD